MGKRRLRLDRTLNGIDGAAELCQYAVPGGIGDPTATGGNQAVKDVSSLGQILEGTDLVGPHQAAVSLDVGCKNRDQPAFGIARFGCQDPPILFLDPSEHHLTTVIWCTGFEGYYSFVQVPGVLNARGQPLEDEGMTEAPGFYFAGVDFSSTRKSGLITAIAEEAQRLVGHIVARR